MKIFIMLVTSIFLSACSVFGDSGVESAPYAVIKADKENNIEVRRYEPMVLVSTSMAADGSNNAFRKLFRYITGNNQGATEIAMTAPVFMDDENMDDKQSTENGSEIAMTAPVFMSKNADEPMMSFVMPKDFTFQSTPKPNDPDVKLSQVSNYKVVAIKFNGTLSDSNVAKHTRMLEKWMADNNYKAIAPPVTAGYNGPLTLPWFRHNEVLIEIE